MPLAQGSPTDNDATNGISSPPSLGSSPEFLDNAPAIIADNGSVASSENGDTFSIDDTMRDYPVFFGRTYHKYKEGSYPFPNDAQEVERMDKQFWLIKAAQGGRLLMAPVSDPQNVLDVGTGTGTWAIMLADHVFPSANIVGIDLSPIQPRHVPQKVIFEQQDCSEPDWCRPLGSFDLIYGQSLLGSLQDYSQYLITARKYLRPGTGWIEACEIDPAVFSDDNTIPHNWPMKRWAEWTIYAAQRGGRPLRIAPYIKRWMTEAGYVDVEEQVFKIPIGSWPALSHLKQLGKHFQELIAETLAAASYKNFSEVLGWDRETIEVFLADTRKSMENRKVHSYYRCHVVYGRRPTADEEKTMGRMAPPPRAKKVK